MNHFPRELRDLSFRSRFALARQIKGQNVAEHSFYVAVYAGLIADFLHWDGNKGQLLQYALWHDTGEAITGDIPGPVKRNMQSEKSDQFELRWNQLIFGDDYVKAAAPDAQMRAIVKTANLLDETLYLAGEMQMGNQAILLFFSNSEMRLLKSIENLPAPERHEMLYGEVRSAISRHMSQQSHLVTNNDDLAPK